MNIVKVENLRKEYPSFLLDNISFNLEAGKITGFVGRNGAGKSTTIKAMLNLIHPSGGKITYFDMPLTMTTSSQLHVPGQTNSRNILSIITYKSV